MCRLCSSVEHKCWQPNSWQEPLTSIAWTNTIEVSGHQQLFGYQHFPKYHLVFGRRKKLVQVWNNLRMSKWWEISLLLTKIQIYSFCINLCYLTDTLLLWSLVYIWIALYNSCLLCKYREPGCSDSHGNHTVLPHCRNCIQVYSKFFFTLKNVVKSPTF